MAKNDFIFISQYLINDMKDKNSDNLIEEQMLCFEKSCGNHKHDIKYYDKVDKDYIDDYEAVGIDWTESSLKKYYDGSYSVSLSVCDPTSYISRQSKQDIDDTINFFKAYISAGGLIILDGKKIWNSFKLVKEIKLLRNEYMGFMFIADKHDEIYKTSCCQKEFERVIDDLKNLRGDVYKAIHKKSMASSMCEKKLRAEDLLNDDNIIEWNYFEGSLYSNIVPVWDITNYIANNVNASLNDIRSVARIFLENDGYIRYKDKCYYDYKTMKKDRII